MVILDIDAPNLGKVTYKNNVICYTPFAPIFHLRYMKMFPAKIDIYLALLLIGVMGSGTVFALDPALKGIATHERLIDIKPAIIILACTAWYTDFLFRFRYTINLEVPIIHMDRTPHSKQILVFTIRNITKT